MAQVFNGAASVLARKDLVLDNKHDRHQDAANSELGMIQGPGAGMTARRAHPRNPDSLRRFPKIENYFQVDKITLSLAGRSCRRRCAILRRGKEKTE
jgi:hypothetical protein